MSELQSLGFSKDDSGVCGLWIIISKQYGDSSFMVLSNLFLHIRQHLRGLALRVDQLNPCICCRTVVARLIQAAHEIALWKVCKPLGEYVS